MRFTEIKGEIPKKINRNYKVKSELEEFMKMNIKAAKVVFGKNEYTSPRHAYGSLWKAAKVHGFPIDVVKHDDEVYLIRRDI